MNPSRLTHRLLPALALGSLFAIDPAGAAAAGATQKNTEDSVIRYASIAVQGHKVFYREAGNPKAPTVLLLHGFPSSSHMFRDLIPKLAAKYHVVAPDLPGFGLTEVATKKDGAPFQYTFDNLTEVVEGFTVAKKLNKYAIYVFDYGAPVGWRLAQAHPERITAIVSQNGNAYEEGLSDAWNPIQKYWQEPTTENRHALRAMLTPEITRWQYLTGVKDPARVSPDGYLFDQALLDRPGQEDIQLDLFRDYANNVARYPQFHEYFRKHQPPLLAVWGAHDPFFLPAGAQAFKRDLPKAEVHLIEDTGHFALESHADEVAARMMDFLGRHLK
jgi:pimeloyl-ACP methyl ester carboxylesterase